MAVSPDAAKTVVGLLGNVIALALFLSPMPTFYQIWKKKSVDKFSAVPYLATLLNCMLWIVYGLPMVHPHSVLILTINGSGVAIELFYVLIFLAYSHGGFRGRLRVLAALLFDIAFVGVTAFLVLTFAHTTERRTMIVGIICIVFNTMMYASPLSVMKLVIVTKSVEFMPLSLSVASFLNAACWTAYALIGFDLYITIPNVLGIVFATAQLVLQAMYYKKTRREIEARKSASAAAEETDEASGVEVVVSTPAAAPTTTSPM